MSSEENIAVTEAETPAVPKKSMSDTQRISVLVVGDVLVFLIFAAIGLHDHGITAGLGLPQQIALTAQVAAPFAAGWFLVSPFVGAFRRGLETQPRAMTVRTILAWLAAWPVGLLLYGIFVHHAVPPVSFAIVTLIANTILLLVWRWPFALVRSLRA